MFCSLLCYWILTWCHVTARRCSTPEDRHIHHSVSLPVPPPPHLNLFVPPASASLQPPCHPQEPGSSALLLWACLPVGHQSDWPCSKCTLSTKGCIYSEDDLLSCCYTFSLFKSGTPNNPQCPVRWPVSWPTSDTSCHNTLSSLYQNSLLTFQLLVCAVSTFSNYFWIFYHIRLNCGYFQLTIWNNIRFF